VRTAFKPDLIASDEVRSVQTEIDLECRRPPCGSSAQVRVYRRRPTAPEQIESVDRLTRSEQDRASVPFSSRHDVHAVVHPVGEIDVEVTGPAEHDVVAGRPSGEGMARRILRAVRLDLDDPRANDPAGQPSRQHAAEQRRRDLVRRTRE
jgi:hypothetical protein